MLISVSGPEHLRENYAISANKEDSHGGVWRIYTVSSWNQTDLDGFLSGKPVMKVDAAFEVTGEISGGILVAYLMYYSHTDADLHDSVAQYTGYLSFRGRIADKQGAFMMRDCGVYENSAPASVLSIINGSGEGGFANISGSGIYFARDGKMIIELDCAL